MNWAINRCLRREYLCERNTVPYRASANTISAPFHPTMIAGALVLPAIRFGNADASITRNPCTP